jgi:hypothetical protein
MTRRRPRRATEQSGETAIQILLERGVRDGSLREQRRLGVLEQRAQFLKIDANQPERAFRIEHREKNEAVVRGGHVANEDLPLAPRVIQLAERLALQLPSELAGGCVNRGRERAGRHHVHRAREAELPHHLPARMQQQREQCVRVIHELLERRFDPRLGDVRSHASALSDSIIAPRMRPMWARGSASVTSTSPSRPIAQM